MKHHRTILLVVAAAVLLTIAASAAQATIPTVTTRCTTDARGERCTATILFPAAWHVFASNCHYLRDEVHCYVSAADYWQTPTHTPTPYPTSTPGPTPTFWFLP